MKELICGFDGGSNGNKVGGRVSPGGAGYIIQGVGEGCYYSPDATNNEMELRGFLELLKRIHIEKPDKVTIYADSKYCIDGATKWIHGWRKRGWVTSAGDPVANQQLWKQIYELFWPSYMTLIWVKGHSGNTINERCDELVQKAKSDKFGKWVEFVDHRKLVTYVLTYIKNGEFVLSNNLLDMISNSSGTYHLVVNSLQRLPPNNLGSHFAKIHMLDQLSVPKARNQILEIFKSSEFTHMTCIDGDDSINAGYAETIKKHLKKCEYLMQFNGTWINATTSFSIIQHNMKYARQCTNWLYVYSKELFEKYPFIKYLEVDSEVYPEDAVMQLLLQRAQINFVTPVIKKELYLYFNDESVISKQDNPLIKDLIHHLNHNLPELNYEYLD